MKLAIWDKSDFFEENFIPKLKGKGIIGEIYSSNSQKNIFSFDGIIVHGIYLMAFSLNNCFSKLFKEKPSFKLAVGSFNSKLSFTENEGGFYIVDKDVKYLGFPVGTRVPFFNYEKDFDEIVKYFGSE